MVERQDSYVEESDIQSSQEDLSKLSDKEASTGIKFPDSEAILGMALEVSNMIPEMIFNNIISWELDFDSLTKDEKINVQETTTKYIQNPSNKSSVLDKYIQYWKNFSVWVWNTIESTYSFDQIREYEVQSYFEENDIMAIWKEINGNNWDGSNIDQNNPKISEICAWSFFTLEQFITQFNKLNEDRISNNTDYLKTIDPHTLISEKLNIKKEKWILYINGKIISNNSIIWNEDFINAIMDNQILNVANENEVKNMLQNMYTKEYDENLYKEIYDKTEESNENFKFHGTWLNFMTESELKDEATILENLKKNIWSKDNIDLLKSKNQDLPKIMAELVIKEDDTPDLKYEKSKLIYLLNNGLFRWFLLAIDSLDQSGVNCCSSSPYLKNDVAYNWLLKHLNRYQKEKNEEFYQLIDDINNININFSSELIKNTSIEDHLRNPNKKNNIEQVVDLAKWFFIQRIKDWQTTNTNIETYKNQLAYILATMELESGYNYAAKSPSWKYRWYGQIDHGYTQLRTIFAQWSWLDIWIKDKSGNAVVWSDIKITDASFTEKNFSAFAFIYGLTYWHLSNQGNLDRYINDNNVNNPDYAGARKVEAWVNSPKYTKLTKLWREIINDSV